MEAFVSYRTTLPLTPAGLTPQWLTNALGQPIEHAEVLDIITGTSTKIRVRIESNADLPQTLIVKGGFEAHSPAMADMYANEARFYSRLAPALPLPTPRCWFAASDPETYQSIVILEDLDAVGVVWLDPLTPQSPDAVARRLEALAQFLRHFMISSDPCCCAF